VNYVSGLILGRLLTNTINEQINHYLDFLKKF
jgi:hypothetical protein